MDSDKCDVLHCGQLGKLTITFSFIIFAELEMHWSDMIMVFIATETAVKLSGDFPVNKEKTLRREVMKGN